jgi:hypothetical protein
MAGLGSGDPILDALYAGKAGRVDIVDVPEFTCLSLSGVGDPDGEQFHAAIQALYATAYSAHFLVKKARGEAPRVMPLEAQWWVEGDDHDAIVRAMTEGGSVDVVDRSRWHWQALIVQLPPVDSAVIAAATESVRPKVPADVLDRMSLLTWTEGRCAQVLHVGPYAEEQRSLVVLHEGIAAHGMRPRGLHHEIYLGDPRRSAPEKLRTLLRQPVEPL